MDKEVVNGLSGSAEAQAYLDLRYRRGDGVQRNVSEAVKLFRVSADGGSDLGRFQLGLCLLDGEGIEEDEEKAVTLFWRSAARGLF